MLYGGVVVVAVALLLIGMVQYFQDDIIARLVAEMNANLKTRVDIGKIEVSMWRKFPKLSVQFQKVIIQGSLSDRLVPLARAEKVHLTFDLWDLWNETFSVDQIFLENADVRLFINEQGLGNYDILKNSIPAKGQTPSAVQFDLRRIRFRQVQMRYTDTKAGQDYSLLAEQTDARLFVKNDDYLILLQGDLRSRYFRVGTDSYFTGKRLRIKGEMQYDNDARKLMIQPSQVFVNQSEFQIMGFQASKPYSFIDLQVEGKNTDVQTLVSLLPESVSKAYASYESKGKVYFKTSVTGYMQGDLVPQVEAQFGCSNASFYETRLKKRIENASLTGTYTNGRQQRRASSSLKLDKLTGSIGGRPFSGSLSIRNFDNPHLAFSLNGTLDMAAVTAFAPTMVRNGSGLLTANVKFEGNLDDLRNQSLRRFVRTAGSARLQNVSFTLANRPLRLSRLNGGFAFDKTNVLVRQFSGLAGSSDFRLDGRFENALSYLLLNEQNLRVVANLEMKNLNLDELLAENPARPSVGTERYRLRLSPRLDLDLTCRIREMRFRRFRARNVRCDLAMRNGIARSRDISLQAANGVVYVNLGVDARQPDFMQVSTNAEFKGISIDSVFYMFEDFGQDFIRSQHLRGKLDARVQTYLVFNEHLDLDNQRLVAEVSADVRDGQLVGFEPMLKLSRFIKQSELANLQFGRMQNNIHIEKQTVYIPLMEITSNIANISVQGTHTFDQAMDYHLRIPVRTFFQRKAVKTATPVSGSQPSLFVTLRGTSDNYKIGYDTQAVRDKIRQDMQARKQNTRQALREAPQNNQPKNAQPVQAEYFDF